MDLNRLQFPLLRNTASDRPKLIQKQSIVPTERFKLMKSILINYAYLYTSRECGGREMNYFLFYSFYLQRS